MKTLMLAIAITLSLSAAKTFAKELGTGRIRVVCEDESGNKTTFNMHKLVFVSRTGELVAAVTGPNRQDEMVSLQGNCVIETNHTRSH